MNSPISGKIKLFILPYILIAIALCGIYTFLNWWLIINLQLFTIKEVIVEVGIPFVLPAIPVLFYLRPRLKLLNLKSKKGSWIDFYTFIVWLSLAAPIIIAQTYITTATGKLTKLSNVNEIEKNAPTKYYTIDSFYLDKTNIGVQSSFDVSGKHDEDFDMSLYVAIPILSNESDTASTQCMAWLGQEYSKTISNRLSDKEKEAQYQSFAEQSQKDFDATDFGHFVYLDKVGNSDKGDGFREAVKECKKYKSANVVVFDAKHESFQSRNGDTFDWIFAIMGLGALVWTIMILIPKFDEEALHKRENGQTSDNTSFKEFIHEIKPKKHFFITPILIYINLAVYLIMVFKGLGFISFKADDLLRWGGNYRPATTNGEWWRLLTNTFLHGGLMHVLANMYGLVFVGIFLEPVLGRGKYLFAYLLTGIIASCASIWWFEATVSVGASGAIFGLYGVFLALLLTKTFPPGLSKAFLLSTLIFVGFNLVMGLTGGIDNAAHIGGLLSGFILGFLLRLTLKKEPVDFEEIMKDDFNQTEEVSGLG